MSLVYNGYTIESGSELVYDPPTLSKWQLFWGSPYGKGLSVRLFVATTVMAIVCPGFRLLYLGALASTVVSLCIGGAISGWSRKKSGGEFWVGFSKYLNENWSQTLAINLVIALATFGISQAVAAVRAAGAKKQLANAAVAARDAKVAELRNTLEGKKLSEIATVVGGYNKTTGQVAVGVKKFDGLPYCAEAVVVEQLGGMQYIDDIVMTSAIRPYNLKVVPVCEYCQSIYTVKNFLPGTPFKPL